MLGRRNRCASTAETGKPKINSSLAESSGTASSNVCSLRTVHEPLSSVFAAGASPSPPLLCEPLRSGGDAGAAERIRFQPLEVGMIKIDGIPVWILKLLPTDHCRPTSGDRSSYPRCEANWRDLLLHYHLDGPRNIARFSDAHDAKYGVRAFKHDQTLNSISLRCCPTPPRYRDRRRRSSGRSNAKERKSRWLIHQRIVGCS